MSAMLASRLTDEELGELEHAASCADGCDCDCGPSRAAFTCADNMPRLIAEVRELRARDERAKIVAWIRDEAAEADYGQAVARLVADAIERGEHER